MKIVVLAGGTSTERDVSLSSGSKIYYALKARGHQAILLDVYLGLEFNEPVTKGLFEKDIDWAKDIRAVSESHPDLSRLKEQRKDGGRSMCWLSANWLTLYSWDFTEQTERTAASRPPLI